MLLYKKLLLMTFGTTYVIWRMPSVGWISKATETHSQYVIGIAFPQHQWLRERALILH